MGPNLIVLGPPGAGKGTQAAQFAQEHGVPRISTGEVLREAVHSGTELGSRIRAVMEAGRLVSDDIMIDLVRERLGRPDATRGFVLDGFPRTVPQARALDAIMTGRGPLVVLEIVVSAEELNRRLRARLICSRCGAAAPETGRPSDVCAQCGGALAPRNDDGENVVRERLKVYEHDTKPLVEYYRSRPTFRTIDGQQTPQRVAAAIRAEVQALVGKAPRTAAAEPAPERLA